MRPAKCSTRHRFRLDAVCRSRRQPTPVSAIAVAKPVWVPAGLSSCTQRRVDAIFDSEVLLCSAVFGAPPFPPHTGRIRSPAVSQLGRPPSDDPPRPPSGLGSAPTQCTQDVFANRDTGKSLRDEQATAGFMEGRSVLSGYKMTS